MTFKPVVLITLCATLAWAQKTGPARSSAAPGASCPRCEEILKQEIAIAQSYVDQIPELMRLGRISELDAYAPELTLTAMKRDLAAFEGGLIPPLPAVPKQRDATVARQRYRSLLQNEIELAGKDRDAKNLKYELGMIEKDMPYTQLLPLELELEAAAFDAGLLFPAKARHFDQDLLVRATGRRLPTAGLSSPNKKQ